VQEVIVTHERIHGIIHNCEVEVDFELDIPWKIYYDHEITDPYL
jgi:hypothetical protein